MIPHSKPGETRATNRHHNFAFTPISINFAADDMPSVFHTLLPTIMAAAMAVATPCTAAAADGAFIDANRLQPLASCPILYARH